MSTINGYAFGNLPDLDFCQADRVAWHVFSLGTETDMHTLYFHGNVLVSVWILTDFRFPGWGVVIKFTQMRTLLLTWLKKYSLAVDRKTIIIHQWFLYFMSLINKKNKPIYAFFLILSQMFNCSCYFSALVKLNVEFREHKLCKLAFRNEHSSL